jgi:hypothetical protein
MSEVDVSLEPMVDAPGGETWQAKIASDLFEVNVQASLDDLLRLAGVRGTSWNDRTCLRVGTCLDAAVFWCSNADVGHDDEVSLLVGHDEETWDVSLTIPVQAIDDLVSEARAAAGAGPEV